MARIAGVDLPRDKRVEVALTYIYGIGRSRSKQILQETGSIRHPGARPDGRRSDQTAQLHRQEPGRRGDRREVALNIKRLIEIGCYRGIRHRRGLPVQGSVRRPMPVRAKDRVERWPTRKMT